MGKDIGKISKPLTIEGITNRVVNIATTEELYRFHPNLDLKATISVGENLWLDLGEDSGEGVFIGIRGGFSW